MRLDLRPSRQLAAALAVVSLAAALGLFLSNLPMLAALPAATACLAWGAWIVRDSLRAPALGIALRGDGHVDVGGERVDDFAVDWRGPLTCMAWRRDGRRVRHVAWPDVVPAAARRELRLWRLTHRADASTRPVAP